MSPLNGGSPVAVPAAAGTPPVQTAPAGNNQNSSSNKTAEGQKEEEKSNGNGNGGSNGDTAEPEGKQKSPEVATAANGIGKDGASR